MKNSQHQQTNCINSLPYRPLYFTLNHKKKQQKIYLKKTKNLL